MLNFQNACPRKCSAHFLRNSTQLEYSRILQTGGVSAATLISTPLVMTCKHGRKVDISIMGVLQNRVLQNHLKNFWKRSFSKKKIFSC